MQASWRNWISSGLAALLLFGCVSAQDPDRRSGSAPGQGGLPATTAATQAADPRRGDLLELRFETALSALREERWEAAVEILRELTREAPEHVGPWVNLGIALSRLGLEEQAMAVLAEAIARDADNALAQHELGILLRRSGQFTRARQAYQAALAAQPDLALAHRNLGLLCDLYLHDLECALAHYERYQNLTDETDEEVGLWLVDLRRRLDKR